MNLEEANVQLKNIHRFEDLRAVFGEPEYICDIKEEPFNTISFTEGQVSWIRMGRWAYPEGWLFIFEHECGGFYCAWSPAHRL